MQKTPKRAPRMRKVQFGHPCVCKFCVPGRSGTRPNGARRSRIEQFAPSCMQVLRSCKVLQKVQNVHHARERCNLSTHACANSAFQAGPAHDQTVHAARELNNLHPLACKFCVPAKSCKRCKTRTTHANGAICAPICSTPVLTNASTKGSFIVFPSVWACIPRFPASPWSGRGAPTGPKRVDFGG